MPGIKHPRRALAGALGIVAAAGIVGGAFYAHSAATPAKAASPFNAHPVTVKPQYQDAGTASGPNVTFGCQHRTVVPCYVPQQIRTAYDIQPLLDQGTDGTGRTIVIIDAYQSPTIKQDLALFDEVFGLPDPTLNIITPNGVPAFDPSDSNQVGWSAEISLDVEWAHAVAPGATIDLVLAPSNQDADILAVTQYAVDHNLGDVISQSFGEAESCADPNLLKAEHEVFQQATQKGMTIFASAGDQGAAQPTCDGSSYFLSASTPASDPLVTSVGGTHLTADQTTGAYGSESVWNDDFGAGGGGFSTVYSRPPYQAPFGVPNNSRGVPDVAYNGDVAGGVLVAWGVPAGVGHFFIFGGTSAGSPQWAAIAALADQMAGARLGFINDALYHIGKKPKQQSDFHDITVGNNSFGGITGYTAAPGWDAASGLGSPDVAKLVPDLINTHVGNDGSNL